jgi:hypothetical protein
MDKIPESYAQFGEEAGKLMWMQHKALTVLDKRITAL